LRKPIAPLLGYGKKNGGKGIKEKGKKIAG
jgi:hypothetical protein